MIMTPVSREGRVVHLVKYHFDFDQSSIDFDSDIGDRG